MSKLNNWMIRKQLELQTRKEEGQGLAEYGLILALVAIAATVGLIALAGGLDGIFSAVTEALNV